MDKRRKCKEDSSAESGGGETMTSSDYERPFIKKFPALPGEETLPSLENDYSRAKAYLMKQCLSSGDNLWDHLNEVLEQILVQRPKDIGCTFEEFSYRIRETRFRSKTDHILDVFLPPRQYPFSLKLMGLLQPTDEENIPDKSDAEEEEDRVEPDVMEMFYYFEQGGVALPREEVFGIGVHLRKLAATSPVEKYRFWGKILGTKENYYVAETELKEEEITRLNVERQEEEERIRNETQEREAEEAEELKLKKEAAIKAAKERELKLAEEMAEAKYAARVKEAKAKGLELPEREEVAPWPPLPPLPEPVIKKFPEVEAEQTGVGINKKVYFVCQRPGDEWIQLPDVTPQQIVAARKIKRAFTGDLESDVITFPSFPGKEKDFLRAQIARISASTQISPLGYYTFNEEEEEEEEIEADVEGILGLPMFKPRTVEISRTNFVVNPDFEPVAIRDLIDPSMSFWVHHSSYILKQGRTTWWSRSAKEQSGEDEGEAEEDEDEEKEIGPALLTPLSEDSAMDAIVPWSVRKTSTFYPEHSIAIVRSNLWPGAYAYATAKKFENIYIGFGHKFSAGNHSPIPIQAIQEEYPLGPEIMEVQDPTPEEEEEWRLAHEVKHEDSEEEEQGDDAEDEDDDE